LQNKKSSVIGTESCLIYSMQPACAASRPAGRLAGL
jgi:hypothetical protein